MEKVYLSIKIMKNTKGNLEIIWNGVMVYILFLIWQFTKGFINKTKDMVKLRKF